MVTLLWMFHRRCKGVASSCLASRCVLAGFFTRELGLTADRWVRLQVAQQFPTVNGGDASVRQRPDLGRTVAAAGHCPTISILSKGTAPFSRTESEESAPVPDNGVYPFPFPSRQYSQNRNSPWWGGPKTEHLTRRRKMSKKRTGWLIAAAALLPIGLLALVGSLREKVGGSSSEPSCPCCSA